MSAKYPFFSSPLFKMPRFSAGNPLNLLTASSNEINPSSRLYLPITRAKLPNALGWVLNFLDISEYEPASEQKETHGICIFF